MVPLVLAGCAVGPDFKTPDRAGRCRATRPRRCRRTPRRRRSATARAQRFVPDKDIPAEWWQVFHSKPLNTLVEQALAANPNLPAAQAALRQAQENVAAQRGSYYPQSRPALAPAAT